MTTETVQRSVPLYVRFDPSVDAANLSLERNPNAGGPNYPLETPDGSLWGLLRTSSDGQFRYLEVLHASKAVPAVLDATGDLNEDPDAPGFRTGVSRAWITASNDEVVLRFNSEITDTDGVPSVVARAPDRVTGAVSLRRDGVADEVVLRGPICDELARRFRSLEI